jgi:LacI family transcriptional regulator
VLEQASAPAATVRVPCVPVMRGTVAAPSASAVKAMRAMKAKR